MRKRKNIIILSSIILAFLVILSIIFAIMNMNSTRIFAGISINTINVSRMEKEEANEVLSSILKNKSSQQIKLVYNDFEYNMDFSSLNIHYNIDDAIDTAYNIGRSGNLIQNNYTILGSLLFKKNIYGTASFDEDSLQSVISDISLELPDKLIEPNYYVEDGNLIITRGTSGNVIDEETLKNSFSTFLNNFSETENIMQIPVKYVQCSDIDVEKIHTEIKKEVKDAYYEENPFKIYAEEIGVDFDLERAKSVISENSQDTEYTIQLSYTQPKITVENLNINAFPDLLASFSTRYDATNSSRSNNLQLAAKKINGTILAPNAEFSYNKIVGERTIAAGYKEAAIYSNGQVVDGIGGGICQISSTLYDAVIFANLDVTTRYNHQFMVSYVSAGRDATVSYGTKDLKFVNNRKYPIKISMTVNLGLVDVKIYGIKEEPEYTIDFEIEPVSQTKYNIKYKQDSSLADGEEVVKQAGTMGGVYNVYKVVSKGNTVVSKTLLSKDTYNAMDRIILTKTGRAVNE